MRNPLSLIYQRINGSNVSIAGVARLVLLRNLSVTVAKYIYTDEAHLINFCLKYLKCKTAVRRKKITDEVNTNVS